MNNYALFERLTGIAVCGMVVLALLAWILARRAGGWHAKPATLCIAASFTLLGFTSVSRLLATPVEQQRLLDIVLAVAIVLCLMFRGVLAIIHSSRAPKARLEPVTGEQSA